MYSRVLKTCFNEEKSLDEVGKLSDMLVTYIWLLATHCVNLIIIHTSSSCAGRQYKIHDSKLGSYHDHTMSWNNPCHPGTLNSIIYKFCTKQSCIMKQIAGRQPGNMRLK